MLNPSSAGSKTEPRVFSYDWKDLALYALGIGATPEELGYLYEARGPKVFPTFAVVPAMDHMMEGLKLAGVAMEQVIHTAQRVTSLREAPPSATVVTSAEVKAIHDLKRFAQVRMHSATRLESGEPLWETDWWIIVRGEGGFGGSAPPRDPVVSLPERSPRWVREQATSPTQALLYRLSGDLNPIHVDPEIARAVGFERGPILHGLATFGFAARAVVMEACGGDATRLETLHGHFKKPVWPGDTLVTEIWDASPERLQLQVRVRERDEVVLGQAWATLRG